MGTAAQSVADKQNSRQDPLNKQADRMVGMDRYEDIARRGDIPSPFFCNTFTRTFSHPNDKKTSKNRYR